MAVQGTQLPLFENVLSSQTLTDSVQQTDICKSDFGSYLTDEHFGSTLRVAAVGL